MSKLFWAMLAFISRLPVPSRWSQGLDFEQYSRGIVMFPFVGLILGAQRSGFYPPATLVRHSASGIVLHSGAGAVDRRFSSGWSGRYLRWHFSARRRERMLEIMRDSRLGTHGGLALIFVLLAKILVVSELALRGAPVLAALAAACAAGRGSAVLLMYRHRYAREEGLGNVFIGKVSGRQTCITLGLAVIVATVLLPGMQGLAAMVVTLAAIFILGQLLKRTLGGQTGDTLGAAIELGELIFLLALL